MSATLHRICAKVSSAGFALESSPANLAWWRCAMPFWLICLVALSFPLSASANPPATSAPRTAPASVAVCTGCHGPQGAGSAAGMPRIAGMDPRYLAHALAMFKAGTRSSDIMQPIARTLSDADIDALSTYFSSQHPALAASQQAPSPQLITAGRTLAMHGDSNGVAACFACHGPGGTGNGQRFPSIAGEPAAFVVNRLHEFQARARAGNVKPGSMTEVASRLTDAEIREASAYLSVTSP
ncbi:c-type cytochrome [Dyella psychrodurans]|uniref:Cytochrome c4 n=1 Tax=Dyella psychrodurans TaxID=1927960 RepID=A0A370X717_9GAMM|nr:c-type cytochrome [Dyella psychrodurans]RDS83995.1 cytochrome c4 [Dyella psychrodurans]